MGWSKSAKNVLTWEEPDELKGTVALIQESFNKPVLVIEKDRLKELL